jgi:hypothetical protein
MQRGWEYVARSGHDFALSPFPLPQVLGEDDRSIKAMMAEFGAVMKPSSFRMDIKPLLKDACT